ncbi:MAG: DUF3990 domain-containing protein [Lachnospiraceae bacterium]|nr:DUF3990 domain-containing protein [Lachnospiraceae bacterium]
MRLYHGSKYEISNPTKGAGKIHNDYGQGFYCTENLELAKEWAASTPEDGVVNVYDFDITGLECLNLNAAPYNIMHWLTVLLEHREVRLQEESVAELGEEYMISNYHVDISGADYIRGYRADDSYYAFVRAFLSNMIGLEQLSRAMKAGNLGEQIFLQSDLAFQRLKFVEAISVNGSEYYEKRIARDTAARKQFKTLKTEDIKERILLIDFIRGEVTFDETGL